MSTTTNNSMITIPTFLRIAIKKMFFSHVDGEFEVRVEHVLAVIKHEEELRHRIPSDWRQYMEQVLVGKYKAMLTEIGYTEQDMEGMSRIELRDTVDEECPVVITEVRGTATGKSTVQHTVTKKAA